MLERMDSSARLALDTQSLEQLRSQARQSPDKALKAAAQQFESVFLNMMLKSMREATPQDGMFDSEQTRMLPACWINNWRRAWRVAASAWPTSW